MKVIHVRIECSNDKEFTCKVTTDNLSREDANKFEEVIAKEIEQTISDWMNEFGKQLKAKRKL